MKKNSKVFIYVFPLILFILFIPACSREKSVTQKEGSMSKSMDKDKFILYKSASMGLSFQYPIFWEIKEIENPKAKYFQIHLVGPRREEIGFPVSLTITAFSKSKSLKDEVDNYLSLKKRLKDFNLFKRTDDFWSNEPAEVVEFTYLTSLPLYAVETQKVIVQEKTIFFKKENILYKISYFVDQARFTEFLEVIEELKKSFSFSG